MLFQILIKNLLTKGQITFIHVSNEEKYHQMVTKKGDTKNEWFYKQDPIRAYLVFRHKYTLPKIVLGLCDFRKLPLFLRFQTPRKRYTQNWKCFFIDIWT